MKPMNPYSLITDVLKSGLDYVLPRSNQSESQRERRQLAIASITDFSTESLFHKEQYSETYFDTLRKIIDLLMKGFPLPEKSAEGLPSTRIQINRLFESVKGSHFDERAKTAMDMNIRDIFEMDAIKEDLYLGVTSAQVCYNYLLEKGFPNDRIKAITKENVRGTLSGLHVHDSIQWAVIGGISATAFSSIDG